LRFRLLADGQGEPVYGFGEVVGEIDEDYESVRV